MRGLLVSGICVLGLALPAAASASTIHVTTQADEKGSNSACSLREAVSGANDGNTGPGGDCDPGTTGPDVIELPASASPYQVTGAALDAGTNISGDLNVTSDVTISGAGASTTTIQSDGQDRVIDLGIGANAVTIRDVTITGGHAPPGPDAGAAAPSGNDSVGGSGNTGGFGGGIFAAAGDLTLTRVVISGNTAGNGSDGTAGGTATSGTNPPGLSEGGEGGAGGPGGGIATGGNLTVTDSTITNNHAGNGGAGGQGGTGGGGSTASTGTQGGDSDGGTGGEGGHGGGIWLGVGRTLTLTRSVVQGNGAGTGGAGGGTGTPGTGGQGTAGSGGKGGCACAGYGGDGGAGGGIALEPGSSVIADAIIRDNSSGAGGVGADAGTGGTGGTGTSVQGHGGDAQGGQGGNAGQYGGVELKATLGSSSTLTNTAVFGNSGPSGGNGGVGGTGGAGFPAGESFGGGGGKGGSVPGIGVSSTQTASLANVTIASNNAGVGGTGGAGGTGPDQSHGGPAGPGGRDAGFEADGGASAVLTHATISANTVGASGTPGGGGTGTTQTPGGGEPPGSFGGVSNESGGTITLRNSIVASNGLPNCAGTVSDGGHNLRFPASDTSCPADVVGDPLLGPLHNNGGFTPTMAIAAGSPARDAGPNGASCAPADQRGMPRPQGAACDIGAFEFALPTITLSSPVNGRRYRKGAHVLASYGCAEAGLTSFIASCVGTVPNLHAINTSTPGTKTFKVTATDTAGNHVTKTVHYFVDGSRPTIKIKTPKDGATYRKGKKVKASYSCNDIDGRIDVKSCKGTVANGKRINTRKTGRHAFTVIAIDRVGNRTVKTVHYKVKKKKK